MRFKMNVIQIYTTGHSLTHFIDRIISSSAEEAHTKVKSLSR